jgi:hypothetical protein
MSTYKIITLVDITRTNPGRSETDKLKINQQANFNSLLQAIGLRTNIDWRRDPEMKTGRLPEPLLGKANHWVWEFDSEREDVFMKDFDPIGHLCDDLHGVPVINRLNNSEDINPAAFNTLGERPNTWIYEIPTSR